MNIIILGGYGRAGSEITKLLLEYTDCVISIAGRNEKKAKQTALEFNQHFAQKGDYQKITGVGVDTTNIDAMAENLKEYDLVIVCIPLALVGDSVVKAALKAGINYLDLNLNTKKQATLKKLHKKIADNGLIFLSECGFVPGVPAFLLRLLRQKFDTLEEAEFSGIASEREVSFGTCEDLIRELSVDPLIMENGIWKTTSLSKSIQGDFGAGIGIKDCYPMRMIELEDLALKLNLKKCGTYVASVGGLVDVIVFLWKMTGLYRFRWGAGLGARLLHWASNRKAKPPFITIVKVRGKGVANNKSKKVTLQISHSDGWIGTAIPVAACVLQLINKTINQPGAYRMGEVVGLDQFKKDIVMLGMDMDEPDK